MTRGQHGRPDTHRVVITGMGGVSAIGHDALACWESMRAGRSGIQPLPWSLEGSARSVPAAQVVGFQPAAHFDRKQLALLDRVSQFTLVAAREAVVQAAVDWSRAGLRHRAAVVIGVGTGGETAREEQNERLYLGGHSRLHPLTIVRTMPNAPASQSSIEFGITGPAYVVSTACSSANYALAQAVQMIRAGQADLVLAGGAEACLTRGIVHAWDAMRVMADDACRPFSADRRGLVLGEGCGMFVLESFDHARRRDAPILAEIAGTGLSSDAADIVLPSVAGVSAAMQRALDDGGLAADEIGYINAHGTGTAVNDAVETTAIRTVFGTAAERLVVSSTKAMHGHALGASGALELIAVIGALREGVIPPTINFLKPDPACDLDVVPNVARSRGIQAALSNSFAFGGLNAVLALRRVDG